MQPVLTTQIHLVLIGIIGYFCTVPVIAIIMHNPAARRYENWLLYVGSTSVWLAITYPIGLGAYYGAAGFLVVGLFYVIPDEMRRYSIRKRRRELNERCTRPAESSYDDQTMFADVPTEALLKLRATNAWISRMQGRGTIN